MPKYFLRIFGCSMNYADAARIAAVLEKNGWEKTDKPEEANAYFLITCAVKQKAEDKVFGYLKDLAKWKKEKPGRILGITGCMVRKTSNQSSDKRDRLLNRSPMLDSVWKIEDTAQLPALMGLQQKSSAENIADYFHITPSFEGKSAALIPIMTGCDNFCTYCVVPFARGREVSRSEKAILTECKNAIKQGVKEITLLGQNVDSYQKQTGKFAQLLEKVAQVKGLQRLRFTSSHPKDFNAGVIEVMRKYPNIEKHLHLPAQHGDNEILRRMNRGYTSEEFLEKIKLLRKKIPSISITTDLIVGFPGESEAQFKRLLKFYREANFDFCFFSKYSPRPETPAAKFPNQIPEKVKAERWRKLNSLVVKITKQKYVKLKGKTLEVLVEKCREGICEGRSSEAYLVKFTGDAQLIREIVKVKITQPREVELWGERKFVF
ncbi:MAG: tRNA (N6-isopentenyl adenosine(37)-C2)-methylthiotransferase MiaB [Candidatus Gracilibacteria bacterium]|nr:tRNA (N6-isopentenyl adenosine(37)-C2)-methylthiotransferase MiaB [Candidatus Gracilibacteria bacterium]MDD5179068.1 tRNA (N6-isopentenyl adenosine(37)-C2)-methylthiotransferase MiaB [Candidatus Gracilibacteria bacterium]